MLGADAAVVGAALSHDGLALPGRLSGPAEALDLEVARGVAIDDRGELAVIGAAPREQDLPVAV
jgi:hypothetical protein